VTTCLQRIYVAAAPADLGVLAATRALPATVQATSADSPAAPAYAVTKALGTAYAGCDDEELEYVAMCDAVDASRAIVGPRGHRVVIAADIAATRLGEPTDYHGDAPPSLVVVTGPLELRDVVSFHIDEDIAPDEDELSWYDVTELGVVVELLGNQG